MNLLLSLEIVESSGSYGNNLIYLPLFGYFPSILFLFVLKRILGKGDYLES